jgi:hypothetical protein
VPSAALYKDLPLAFRARNVLKIAVDEDQVVDDAADPGIAGVIIVKVMKIEETIGSHRFHRMVQAFERNVGEDPVRAQNACAWPRSRR